MRRKKFRKDLKKKKGNKTMRNRGQMWKERHEQNRLDRKRRNHMEEMWGKWWISKEVLIVTGIDEVVGRHVNCRNVYIFSVSFFFLMNDILWYKWKLQVIDYFKRNYGRKRKRGELSPQHTSLYIIERADRWIHATTARYFSVLSSIPLIINSRPNTEVSQIL